MVGWLFRVSVRPSVRSTQVEFQKKGFWAKFKQNSIEIKTIPLEKQLGEYASRTHVMSELCPSCFGVKMFSPSQTE